MLSQDDIHSAQELLAAHRRTLAFLLAQKEQQGGDTYAQPSVVNGIAEARSQIRRIKAELRTSGVSIEDAIDDVKNQRSWREITLGVLVLISFLIGKVSDAAGLIQLSWSNPAMVVIVAFAVAWAGCVYLKLRQRDAHSNWLTFSLVTIPMLLLVMLGLMRIWEGNTGLLTFILVAIGSGVLAIGCSVVLFNRKLIIRDKRSIQEYYSKQVRSMTFGGLCICLAILVVGAIVCFRYPTKRVILVADFSSQATNSDSSLVNKLIWDKLNHWLGARDDVQLVHIPQSFIEKTKARSVAREYKASVMIWGSYSEDANQIYLATNVDMLCLRCPPELGPNLSGDTRPINKADQEAVNLKVSLAEEMTYLSLFTLGLTQYEAGDWNNSFASFDNLAHQESSFAHTPNDSRALLYRYRGNTYIQLGKPDLAIDDLNLSIQLNSSDRLAYLNRGNAYFDKQEYPATIKDYTQAIDLGAAADCQYLYANRGVSYYYTGDYTHAITDFSEAIKRWPGQAISYNWRGFTYATMHQVDKAIPDFDQAIKLDPEDASAYLNRGNAYADQALFDRAIADYDQGLKLTPNDETMKQWRDVAKYSQKIGLSPNDPDAYFGRGLAYESLSDWQHARDDYSKAVELKSDFATAYMGRGNAFFNLNDKDRAFNDYSQAINLKLNNAGVYRNRGLCYEARGNIDLAVGDYSQALKIDPAFADAYIDRGRAYRLQGDTVKAIADFKAVIVVSKEPDLIKQAQDQLKALGTQ